MVYWEDKDNFHCLFFESKKCLIEKIIIDFIKNY